MAERRPLYDAGAGGIKEFDPASGDTLAGAGAGGSSGINYIANPDFEIDATGWAAYADAAGVSPVDGTGGSPVVTITRSTSSPLRKTASGLITKDAANRQGNGVSYDFTIDSAQKGRALSVLFDYIVGSGTFAAGDASSDGDITVYIYDVTNARLINLSDRKLYSNSATLSSKFIGLFQASPDSTSYRLIIHCGSTSASAYTLKFDEVQVSPLASFPATVVTDWQAYTPTFGAGFGTPTNVSFYWRRVGSSIQIKGSFTNGSTSAAESSISLPSGLSMDVGKLVSLQSRLGTANRQTIGSGGVMNTMYACTYYSTFGATKFLVTYLASSGTMAVVNVNDYLSTSDGCSIEFEAPIAGWGSAITSALTGDDGRVVAAKYSTTVSATSDSSNPIQWSTKVHDTHNAVTTGSAWKFTAPVSGYYRVAIQYHSSGATVYARLYKNGADQGIITGEAAAGSIVSGGASVELKAGDYIDVRSGNSSTVGASVNYSISIDRTGGNAVAVGQINEKWPVGSYIQHAGATAPSGFLACDGTAVSRLDYSALFAVIGTTYGAGNGSTTFNLPDARGLVMVGAGANGTLTRADASAYNGGVVGASRNDQMQGHWHEAWGSSSNSGSSVFSINDRPSPVTTMANSETVQDATTDGTNGTPRTGNETRPAEIAVLVCIKY